MSVSPQQMQSLLAAASRAGAYSNPYLPSAYQPAANYVSNAAGEGSNALGIYGGIQRGGLAGYGGAALNAGNLYQRATGDASYSPYTSDLGSALGIYGGIKAGGVAGDTQAGLSAARLGLQGATQSGALSAAAASPYMQALGYAAIPLELYNFAKNWQSGDTGSDALSGAETGAAIGSVIPGIGTVIGGLVGGAAGALSSAFGGGRHDPETTMWQHLVPQINALPASEQQAAMSELSPSQAYQGLAGIMDAKNNSPGSSEQLEQLYGRAGEGKFLTDMGNQINSAYGSGQIKPGESASDIYSGVISPWLAGKGVTIGQAGALGQTSGRPGMIAGTNQQEGTAMQGDITDLIGDYTSGNLTNQSRIGIAGQTDPTLAAFSGLNAYQQAAQQPQAASPGAPAPAPAAPQYAMIRPTARMAASGGFMRKTHYDDGGDVYVDPNTYGIYSSQSADPYSDPLQPVQVTAPYIDPNTMDTSYGGTPNPLDTSQLTDTGISDFGPQYDAGIQNIDLNTAIDPGQAPNFDLSQPMFGSGSNPLGSTLGALAPYAPLLPLISALGGGSRTSAPALPSQYQGTPNPYQTPNFQQTPNPYYQNMSTNDWLHWGESPQPQFYMNNRLPPTVMSAPNQQAGAYALPYGSPYAQQAPQQAPQARTPFSTMRQPQVQLQTDPGMGYIPPPTFSPPQWGGIQGMPRAMAAAGGLIHFAHGGFNPYMPMPHEGHVRGPGDGTSDDIDAKLSDGEYVIDAPTVSLLGNGSNEAGARRLDEFRQNVRRHAGKKLARGRQPMHALPPEHYLDAEYA